MKPEEAEKLLWHIQYTAMLNKEYYERLENRWTFIEKSVKLATIFSRGAKSCIGGSRICHRIKLGLSRIRNQSGFVSYDAGCRSFRRRKNHQTTTMN